MQQWHTLKAYSDLLSHKSAAAKKNVYENTAKRSSLRKQFFMADLLHVTLLYAMVLWHAQCRKD